MFQKMSLISSAKANPVGIAIVAEEIIALGGNVLISDTVAIMEMVISIKEEVMAMAMGMVMVEAMEAVTGVAGAAGVETTTMDVRPGHPVRT